MCLKRLKINDRQVYRHAIAYFEPLTETYPKTVRIMLLTGELIEKEYTSVSSAVSAIKVLENLTILEDLDGL